MRTQKTKQAQDLLQANQSATGLYFPRVMIKRITGDYCEMGAFDVPDTLSTASPVLRSQIV